MTISCVPINLKVADIKGLGVMRLPALILTHGTQQINLVIAADSLTSFSPEV